MKIKIVTCLALMGLGLMSAVGLIGTVRAAGVVEDQDTIQNPGPGNLDSPTEPNPDAKTNETKEEIKTEATTPEADKQPDPAAPEQH